MRDEAIATSILCQRGVGIAQWSGNASMIFMRAAERVDRVIPNWIEKAFVINQDELNYVPFDLNLPIQMPKRPSIEDYRHDPPISQTGIWQAQLMARLMRLQGVPIKFIYASPALRAVQTAAHIHQQLNKPDMPPIRIEPGLFETYHFYSTYPNHMTPEELWHFGYPVDVRHNVHIQPTMPGATGMKQDRTYTRIGDTTREIAARHQDEDGCILIVAHAITQDAGMRTLLDKTSEPIGRGDLIKMGLVYPYCSVVAVHRQTDHVLADRCQKTEWRPCIRPLPPLTHMGASNVVDKAFPYR